MAVKPNSKATARRSAPYADAGGGRAPIVRVLPVLIFFGVLMLSVRVTDLFMGLTGLGLGAVSVAELQAQQPAKPAAPAATPASAPASAPAPAPAAGGDAAAEGRTQTEMDVLEKLRERRAVIDARERDVERREEMLRAAESQIDRKVAEMKTLQSTIEGLLRQYNDQEDNKMRSLVKIYENMKPKEAAKIFEQLDMSILLEVVERMKEQKVAPIMAEMDPMKAKGVTAELAQRRQMPTPKGASGG
ncbi:MotE family protein [Magnetospirillum fulvum]|uniref:FlaA protein n=1 Tax=Magnetospirillum fulvum MGU-K5 TaxID=1316936 RepID=S9SDJ5_MAGFU|nr:FlaA protein [Magnetospirillum fulvum]EPY02103.1 FlaA protein [Magnetospirillum fulvum MGU-K5]